MRELNKTQSLMMLLGGVLMVVGASLCVLMLWQKVAGWLYLAGAVMFTTMQAIQTYEGKSLAIGRLKRIQSLAGLMLVLAGVSMVDSSIHLFEPLFPDRSSYFTYLYNKWVVALLIGALLEVYTVLRISKEMEEEGPKR